MSLQFIVWEDWEGNNGNSVPTEDEMMPTHFRRMTPTTTMTETSRDDEQDKNVMVQLMFGTLCPAEDEACPRGRRCRRRSAACPKRQLSATTAAQGRRGGSVGQNDHGPRLHIPAGILRNLVFSVPVAFFSQES